MGTGDSLEKSLMEAEGKGGDRGWNGWMASPMQWTWTWANSGRWWDTGRPGVLQSIGSQRVGQDWVTEQQKQQQQQCQCRRDWQFTPVLLPGKAHGQRSLVGYSPWDCKESDMTEQLHLLHCCKMVTFVKLYRCIYMYKPIYIIFTGCFKMLNVL